MPISEPLVSLSLKAAVTLEWNGDILKWNRSNSPLACFQRRDSCDKWESSYVILLWSCFSHEVQCMLPILLKQQSTYVASTIYIHVLYNQNMHVAQRLRYLVEPGGGGGSKTGTPSELWRFGVFPFAITNWLIYTETTGRLPSYHILLITAQSIWYSKGFQRLWRFLLSIQPITARGNRR